MGVYMELLLILAHSSWYVPWPQIPLWRLSLRSDGQRLPLLLTRRSESLPSFARLNDPTVDRQQDQDCMSTRMTHFDAMRS